MAAVDVTDASFEADVLARSEEVPVVIDLWAPWCGPCRVLGPIIERVVEATDGAAALAKVNVDENPRVSATFHVQSIPAVYAVYKRQVVDQFIGALPEAEVGRWVDGVIAGSRPSEADLLVAEGGEASLRKALELEPAHARAIVELAGLLVERAAEGDAEEALALLSRLPETAETRRLAALARTGGALLAEAGEGPAGDEELDARMEELLEKVPGDDDARQAIVDLIETMPPDDDRRDRYRRALAAKLF